MSELTTKQLRAVEALLCARTLGEAARAAGVSPRSLTRWMDDSTFRAELSRREGAAIHAAARRLVVLVDQALAAVEEILMSDAVPMVRLRAAEMVLSNLLKLRELVDLEARISALEAKNDNR